ncbi:MAG: GGDEF domain-containing protein [Clostridiales bacterium]|nr:GGDEF domain-containing protein [Clostridiales bacterium]
MVMRSVLLWQDSNTYTQLASENRKAISEYNLNMLSALTLVGAVIMLLPLTGALLAHHRSYPAYIFVSLFYLALFFLFRIKALKRFILIGLYLVYSIFFLLAVCMSVVYSPDMRATVLLGVFCVMPLGFIDRPIRMNLFAAFWFVVHTVLAFVLKPENALVDMMNCICFGILGCILGNITVRIRLDNYEANRRLTIEKETDELTGLSNRRKLFQTLAYLETAGSKKPSGIMMIDIDNFKDFNDTYGHAAGDRCLACLGKVMMTFSQSFRLHFYRYGGEEFVAMAYDYDREELYSIAESLKIAVMSTVMDSHIITVSIGIAYCGNETVRNYENVIDRADQAVYCAKRLGRNVVCMEKNQSRQIAKLLQ